MYRARKSYEKNLAVNIEPPNKRKCENCEAAAFNPSVNGDNETPRPLCVPAIDVPCPEASAMQ